MDNETKLKFQPFFIKSPLKFLTVDFHLLKRIMMMSWSSLFTQEVGRFGSINKISSFTLDYYFLKLFKVPVCNVNNEIIIQSLSLSRLQSSSKLIFFALEVFFYIF